MKELQKALLLTLLAILTFIFLNYLAISLSNIAYPYDVEQSEGFMLPRIKFLLEGHPEYLYNSIYSYPYFFTNDYPPTFYLITTFLSVIFGYGFFAGRLLSFLSSLLIGIFIFKIVKKETKNNYLSVLSSLLFFSSYVIFYWGSIFRNDMMALMFSVLGIYFLFYHDKSKKETYSNNKNLAISILFFILAVTTKQTYVIAAISSFLYLFIVDRKRGNRFLIFFILPVVSLFILLNILTQGQFLLHTIIYNSKTTLSQNARDLFYGFITINSIILTLSLVFFSKKRTELISIYFLVSVVFGLFQIFKTGGATNYFIEPITTMSIIAGPFLYTFQKKEKLFTFLLVLLILQMFVFIYFNRHLAFSVFEPQKYFAGRNQNSNIKILDYIRKNEGNVFIQNSIYMIANEGDILYETWGIYDIPENYINKTRFEEFFKNKKYTLIFINNNFRKFPNLLNYIEENYNLVDMVYWYDNDYKELNWKVYMMK